MKMSIRNLLAMVLSPSFLLCSTIWGQSTTPSPRSDRGPNAEVFTVSRSVPLEQELVRSEIEPFLKKFEMNLRFLRAKYSTASAEHTIKHLYVWDYFPEVVITVLFVEYPGGFLPQASADDRKKKADELLETTLSRAKADNISRKDIKVGAIVGKQVEFTVKGEKHIARAFADCSAWYFLFAQPRTKNAGPLIDRVFESFKFVRK